MKKRLDLVIVDDDKNYIKYMKLLFEKKLGIKVKTISKIVEAIKFIEINNPRVALIDIFFKNSTRYCNGLEVIEKLSSIVDTNFIVITGEKSIQDVFRAGQLSVKDIVDKSTDHNELIVKVQNILKKQKEIENSSDGSNLPAFIGISDKIKNIKEQIKIASDCDLPILIKGETGVGKDIVARLIHLQGNRKNKAFRVFDSGKIDSNLAPSELFGHKKGSFTGADKDNTGIFRESDGGTLFIDEISNLSIGIQGQLLRALNRPQKILPVGSTVEYEVDVKIICATNKDILELVHKNEFREDLYARIDNPLRINIPPLRKRREDILPIIEYFIKSCKRNNFPYPNFSDDSMDFLINIYKWPRNVRELEQFVIGMGKLFENKGVINKKITIEKLIHIDQDRKKYGLIEPKEQEISGGETSKNTKTLEVKIPEGSLLKESKETVEKVVILNTLKKTESNRKKAAELLGITREHLQRLIRKYQLH